MISFEPQNLTQPQVHAWLLGGVAPRPIALVSTISEDGVNNLSPFSFFNAFGSNPPIVAFSAARRAKDSTLKDTYNNLITTKECVIHAVTYSMVDQINLAATEFPSDVDEFEKAGFTAVPSDIVKPKRVMESPFHMECKLFKMVSLGEGPGSGNLAICEVVKFHIANEIITDGRINPQLIDHVARNGGEYYTRAHGDVIFSLKKPLKTAIGFDGLPDYIKNSEVYSASDLARFAIAENIPTNKEVMDFVDSFPLVEHTVQAFHIYLRENDLNNLVSACLYLAKINHFRADYLLELSAKALLKNNKLDIAWMLAAYKGLIYN